MQTRMAWLLFGLAALTIPFAESLLCYDCIIDETDGLSEARTTCPDSLTPSNAATCEGAFCAIIWSDYGNQGYFVNLTCQNETFDYSGPISVDLCLYLKFVKPQYEFYVYNDMCCFTTSETQYSSSGSSIQYNKTSCGCDKDYCKPPQTTAAPTTTMTTTAAPTTTMTTDAPIIMAVNETSFANRRRSNLYIYGFAVIVTNFIVALTTGLDQKVQ